MISIIIPAHNEKENLIDLLDYFSRHIEDRRYELIIALSSETADGSEHLPLPSNATLFRSAQKGRAVQMNEATKYSNGGILVFLHADVKPPKTFLDDIVQMMGRGYQAGFFSYRFDDTRFLLRINAYFTASDGLFTGGGDQCLFIQRSVFERLGKFDEQQLLMEDFEFFDRMKKHRVKYTIVKNDLIVSARKYRSNSYVRVNLCNLLLVVLYKCGCAPSRLKALHDRLLRIPYQQHS